MANLNLNKVILGGRISNDLELKQTTSGISVITFSIAINRRGSKDEQQKADFIEIKAWRQTAEFVSRYFRKGSSICIVGELQTDSWTDQQGQKRYKTYVNASEAMFVDSKSDDGAGQNDYNAYGSAAPAPQFEDIKEDEDLPF